MGRRQNTVFQRTPAPEADEIALVSALVERAAPFAAALVRRVVILAVIVCVLIAFFANMVIAMVVLAVMRILGATALGAGVTAVAFVIFARGVICPVRVLRQGRSR